MARLSDELIDQIKRDVSLIRVAEAKGIKLKKHGKDYLGHCPFHNDRTPSFVISPESNLWHCLGACNAGGSVIDFVMKIEGVSFRHAVELLKNDVMGLSPDTKPVKRATTQKLDSPLAALENDQALLKRVVDYYHETLKQSPEAIAYLESRGLNDPALIEHFRLGYANRSLGYRLPQKNRKQGAEIRGQLQRIGLLRESGHEHFNGSLVIPVVSGSHAITEVYGRKLLDRLRKGTPKHLYLPGEHQGVFNPSAFENDEIILCESLIDALTFWRWGFKHVTTSYGIAGFTDELFDAFKTYGAKRVLIAYDRDDAGNQAAIEVAKKLQTLGVDCYRVLFPKGMDANEYALKMTPARKSLELVIRKAEWVSGDRSTASQQRERPAGMPGWGDASGTNAAEGSEKNDTPSPLAAVAASTDNLPASPQPSAKTPLIEAEVNDNEIHLDLDDRHYRIRGFKKAMSYEVLKINVLVSNEQGLHVDTFDLYNAKPRQLFIKQAAMELGVVDEVLKKDLGKVLLKLEALQDAQIQAAKTPKDTTVSLSTEDHQAALALLTAPNLVERILTDFNRAGVVGEESNKLVGYLSAVSRKLDNPLAVIIQSTSAAGKSSLMNAVLAMMPEEERVHYSAMTGQSLFYMGDTNLKHKILAIAEEEGAEHASYALKLLQSEGELTMASTGKDEATGNLVTKEYRVEGPVMLFLTTTAIDIDEELMNRCVVLTVNESREQTERIHALQRQRRTLSGLKNKVQKQTILTLHRNAQRLLKPYLVINPYADQLTFLSDKTRTRRDHEKYLSLIDTITLLHQYQRPKKTEVIEGERIEYIEVTLDDIALANQLAHEVLGKTLDELPPQTRQMLQQLKEKVMACCEAQQLKQSDYRFTRSDLRQLLGWTYDQVRVHLERLIKMEYVLVHRGRRGQSFVYELLYDGEGSGNPFLCGLIDTDTLKQQGVATTTQRLGGKPDDIGVSLGEQWAGNGDAIKKPDSAITQGLTSKHTLNGQTHGSLTNTPTSYRSVNPSPLAASGVEV